MNEDCKFLVVNRLQRCKLLSPAIYCPHSAQLSLSLGRHKSGGQRGESEERNYYVLSSQFLCLSQSLDSEDLKTIKGIPIDTGVVIVCAKKTDSDGLGCSICVWPVLSDHAPVVETIPGYKHGPDSHVIHTLLLPSAVFLEPTKPLFNTTEILQT